MNNLLDEVWAQRVKKMWKWMRGFHVDGAASFKNTDESCTISLPRYPSTLASGINWPILAVVTSYGPASNGAQWKQIDPQSGSNAARFKDNGLTSELLGPAFEATGQTRGISGDGSTNGTQVWLWMRPDSNGAQVPVFTMAGQNGFWARLTDTNGAFIEVNASGTTITGGASASASVEMNAATGWKSHATTGQIVWMQKQGTSYRFEYSIRLANDTTHVGFASCVAIPTTNGSDNVLETAMLSGTNGGAIRLKAGSANYQTLVWNDTGGNWTIDFPRGHS